MDLQNKNQSAVDDELKQTYEFLKDIEKDLLEEKNELIKILSKKPVETLSPSVNPEDIQIEQLKFVKALLSDEPVPDDRLRPVINSVDDFTSLESELLQEISELQIILDQTKSKFSAVKSSISSLVNEKNNLQKMKEVCSDAVENVDTVTNDKDIAKIKRSFQIVKADLARVVDIIYPEDNFHGLLRVRNLKSLIDVNLNDLVDAYSKDGDEKYIEIGDVSLDCVQSLIEADIAMYHRNDKNKIRLVDLL